MDTWFSFILLQIELKGNRLSFVMLSSVTLPSDGFSVQSVQGMLYNPVLGAWSWTNSTAINYALHAVKVRDDPQPERAEEEQEDHTSSTQH